MSSEVFQAIVLTVSNRNPFLNRVTSLVCSQFKSYLEQKMKYIKDK